MRMVSLAALLAVVAAPAVAADRYSNQPAAPRTATPNARSAGLRLLTWPGKTMPSELSSDGTPAPAYSPPPLPAPAPAPMDVAAVAAVTPAPMAAPVGLPPVRPLTGPALAAPRNLPTSLYDAPPPRVEAAAPVLANVYSNSGAQAAPQTGPAHMAAAGGQPPRAYSLHRAYGVQPDPVPLSPQFFAQATPDLAEPPPPLPPRIPAAGTATAAQVNAARELRQQAQSTDNGG